MTGKLSRRGCGSRASLLILRLRNNIASARLAGLEDDLKLNESGTQFNVRATPSVRHAIPPFADLGQTAVSILFVGYLLMQVPSNLLLNKMGKPGKYLPACVGCSPPCPLRLSLTAT